jgi:hypothetical protein
MSKGIATENDVVKFIFNLTSMPSYGSNLYLSLHTSDPGEDGTQETNEVTTGAYASYARQPVARDSGGWTVATTGLTKNVLLIQFPTCTGGTGAIITHVGIGTSVSGAGQLLYSGLLNESLAVSNLVQPQFAINALQVQED